MVFNGQILPRDHDRFTFRAEAGQHLVARVDARALVPYQADSVPGWMQATIALYDADGKEVAYADEFRYDPDPVLTYQVAGGRRVRPRDPRRDRAWPRRLRVPRGSGRTPVHRAALPARRPRGRSSRGRQSRAGISSWRQVPLDTRAGKKGIRAMAWRQGDGLTNEVAYEVDTLPEVVEAEPNDDVANAPGLEQGVIVNGQDRRARRRGRLRLRGARRAGDRGRGDRQAARLAHGLHGPLDRREGRGHRLERRPRAPRACAFAASGFRRTTPTRT